MMADDCNAVQQLQQELEQLKESGAAKRRRHQGELEKLGQIKEELHARWCKTTQRRPLHAYVKAVTSENHLVPSKILSQQAKLAQSLHLMEVYMQQKTLVEKQRKQYAELLCHQAAEQEDIQSEVTLDIMNQLCRADSELRGLKEEMRKMGFQVNDQQEDEEEEEESACASEHAESNKSANESSEQQQEKRPWWWPIHHSEEKQKAPLPGSAESVASDTSSVMNLLWMPPKFKVEQSPSLPSGSLHTTLSNKSDVSPINDKPVSKLWWPVKMVVTEEKNMLDGSTHSESDKSQDSDVSYNAKPVARQWWPQPQPQSHSPPPPQETEKQQQWWESFYR